MKAHLAVDTKQAELMKKISGTNVRTSDFDPK
jgi:hypothetical protein